MDEPGHHFSGVKRPPGCRETGAPRKPDLLPTKVSSHHQQASCGIVDASGQHRHAYRIVLGCRTKAGPPLSFPTRRAVPWLPMSTSEQTERPLRFHAPQRPPRRGGTSARGGPEAPRDNLIAVHRLPCDELDWGQPRVSPRRSHDEFGLGQATRCHHGARTPTQTNIFLHGVRRARPLLSARRRVPALPVSVRAAIPARRAHHPDHLEEEPAAGPSLTRRRARGKLLSSTQ